MKIYQVWRKEMNDLESRLEQSMIRVRDNQEALAVEYFERVEQEKREAEIYDE